MQRLISERWITITTLNDTITVIMLEKFNAKIDLWMLDNVECLHGFGVEASWTQMLSIIAGMALPLQFVHIYFTNGDFLLTCSGDTVKRDDDIWLSCNCCNCIDKKKAKNVSFSVYRHQIFKYTESLVSILCGIAL
ncbi:hypothetical protein POM88_038101 [Heracleum sosnowskyi]|uniref:Uncharacterized protein n=1 Tax=Heracleum sosnowskyi TaxID=360622 RepID=A0AAD8HRC8_9APIA|nr:hypothetical protein POM88_038101 [Heracleum sosnowskyi]